MLTTFLCGMCVGAADIVPGISGGTVAFIIGIYEKLLDSIASINKKTLSHLVRFKFETAFRQIEWQFLVPLLLGIGTSFILLASFINYILHHEIYRIFLYSGFMGLVVGSAIFCAKLLSRISLKVVLLFILGAICANFLSGSKIQDLYTEKGYDVPLHTHVDGIERCRNVVDNQILNVKQSYLTAMVSKKLLFPSDIILDHTTKSPVVVQDVLTKDAAILDFWIILSGMIAISAMLLPGISGSYMLQVLGLYGLVLSCLVDWIEGLKAFTFDAYAFRVLASMAVGIVIGAFSFSRVVSFLLRAYRETTIAVLVGFMIGALGSVWPFWSYSYELMPINQAQGATLVVVEPLIPDSMSSELFIAAVVFVVGVCMVFWIEYVSRKKQISLEKLP